MREEAVCSDTSWSYLQQSKSKEYQEVLTYVEHVLGTTLPRVGGWYLLLAPFKPSEVL